MAANDAAWPNVLILAPPKSGTTILYYLIHGAMPPNVLGRFEPDRLTPRRAPQDRPVLTKALLSQDRGVEHFSPPRTDFYHKKILIVRDPRDVVVSLFLYMFFRSPILEDWDAFGRMIEALKAKEADPGSIPLIDLVRLRDQLEGNRFPEPLLYSLEEFRFMGRARAAHRPGDLFELKYRDIVDRRLGPLSEYLGFEPKEVDQPPERLERVGRTRSRGDWRNWFTPADVAFFWPRLSEFMADFGLPDDWDLPAGPQIDPAAGSRYVLELARRRGAFKPLDLGDLYDRAPAGPKPRPGPTYRSSGAAITDLAVIDERGAPAGRLAPGQPARIRVTADFQASFDAASVRFLFRPSSSMTGQTWCGHRTGQGEPVPAGSRLVADAPFNAPDAPGVYLVGAAVIAWIGDEFRVLHAQPDLRAVVVAGPGRTADFQKPAFQVR
jgi:hypothetical protein